MEGSAGWDWWVMVRRSAIGGTDGAFWVACMNCWWTLGSDVKKCGYDEGGGSSGGDV